MSRIPTPAVESATGDAAELFAQIKKSAGKVPNTYASIGYRPAALKAILNADAVLAAGTLGKQDQETVKLAVSAAVGCDYCEAAHSLLGELAGLKPDQLQQIRAGSPHGRRQARRPGSLGAAAGAYTRHDRREGVRGSLSCRIQ